MSINDALKEWRNRHIDLCNSQVEYRDLAPTDQIENGDEYIKALRWALNESRIRNIALAGPYGSGKSSIIESYLRRGKNKKHLRISMATFIENTEKKVAKNGDNCRTKIPSKKIEEGILKQLFYKVDHKKIPQSRYRKLHRIGFWKCYIWLASIFAMALGAVYVFWPDNFSFLVKRIEDAGTRLNIKESWSKLFSIIMSTFSVGAVAYGVRHLFSRFQIKEAKIPGTDATVVKQSINNDSVFDKNMDEIVYFFEETKYEVVFFEDLDRLDDPMIFVRLRELNTILNNYDAIKHRIVFVYAVKDDIFKDADRTKFFDFIIPVIPVINSTNSGDILLKMLEEAREKGINHDISQGFIDDISPYIQDMRTLLNIYNEFVVYKNTIRTEQDLNIQDEKMMSLIIFKNLYPRDFADIQMETGIIKQAFKDKHSFVEMKREEIQKEIDSYSEKLEGIKEDILVSTKEVKVSMMSALTEWKGILTNITFDYPQHRTFYSENIMEDTFNLSFLCIDVSCNIYYIPWKSSSTTILRIKDPSQIVVEYVKRYEQLKIVEAQRVNELQQKIENYRKRIYALSSQPVYLLINEYEAKSLLSDTIRQNKLLVFLLRKGYVNEEYANYINYFKGTSITKDDMNFILSIKDRNALPFTYTLSKIPQLLKRLQLHEFSQKEIYNFDLLESMLSSRDYDDLLHQFMSQLADENDSSWKFIDAFMERTMYRHRFIQLLIRNWGGMWKYISENAVLSYERKIFYLEQLINSCEKIESIADMNIDDMLTCFLEGHEDILQQLRNSDEKKLADLIDLLDVKFYKLNIESVSSNLLSFVFDNCHYIINTLMLQRIVELRNEELKDRLTTQNYTVLSELGYEPLLDYVGRNLKQYIQDIVLAEENTKEREDRIIELLGGIIDDAELCDQVVLHEEFCLDDISLCCNDMIADHKQKIQSIWDSLLNHRRIAVTWENVMRYWESFLMTSELIEFIEKHDVLLAAIDYSCVDVSFIRAFILANVELECYARILSVLRWDEFNIPIGELSLEKVQVLIELHYFPFTAEDYASIKATYPDLTIGFIASNQDAYMGVCMQLSLDTNTVEELLSHRDVKSSVKEYLLREYGVQNMSERIAQQLITLPVAINKSVFKAAWIHLNSEERVSLMMKYLDILEADDFERCFLDLDGEYSCFTDRSKRKSAVISDTTETRKLIGRLQRVDYITSWKEPEKNGKTTDSELIVWIKQKR